MLLKLLTAAVGVEPVESIEPVEAAHVRGAAKRAVEIRDRAPYRDHALQLVGVVRGAGVGHGHLHVVEARHRTARRVDLQAIGDGADVSDHRLARGRARHRREAHRIDAGVVVGVVPLILAARQPARLVIGVRSALSGREVVDLARRDRPYAAALIGRDVEDVLAGQQRDGARHGARRRVRERRVVGVGRRVGAARGRRHPARSPGLLAISVTDATARSAGRAARSAGRPARSAGATARSTAPSTRFTARSAGRRSGRSPTSTPPSATRSASPGRETSALRRGRRASPATATNHRSSRTGHKRPKPGPGNEPSNACLYTRQASCRPRMRRASGCPSSGFSASGNALPLRRQLTRGRREGRPKRVPRVTFLPLESTVDCADGESVFAAAQRGGVPIATACVGKATCGLCRVKIVSGAEFLTPINRDEQKHLGNTYFITKLRLSCQCVVSGGDRDREDSGHAAQEEDWLNQFSSASRRRGRARR